MDVVRLSVMVAEYLGKGNIYEDVAVYRLLNAWTRSVYEWILSGCV